jgi:acrylyl-CoA reductase (NADPH)/3-hydroxypropionyl-CoA dehydratase/3-hydroxypropionyl-CoA synthetase
VAIESRGAYGVDRHDPELSSCFTPVPATPSRWQSWAEAGQPFIDAIRQGNDGELCDYAISHAGEKAFPRTFQALNQGGVLTFFGASSGYKMTFLGKAGSCAGSEMLRRVAFRAGEAVVVFYGTRGNGRDDDAILSIEAARSAGARIVVVTDEDAERDFVLSLGFGDAVLGAVSLSEIQRRAPNFIWPDTLPSLPNPQRETVAFKEVVRLFTENTFKPLGATVGKLLRSADNPRGMPDLIFERAHCDSLAVSTMLVKPNTGRVVYTGNMEGRRYSFYAPQVWMRQRRIYMPSAAIFGTHLCNAAEIVGLNRMINAGAVQVAEPHIADWKALPTVHQAMWENRLPEHTGGTSNAIVNHALPEAQLKSRDELLTAWAASTKRH